MDWSRSKVAPVIIPTILSPTGRGMLPGKPTSKDLPGMRQGAENNFSVR